MSFLLHEVRFLSFLSADGADLLFVDRVLRSVHSMDYRRLYSILSQMEAPTRQDTNPGGAMGMHETGFTLALYH